MSYDGEPERDDNDPLSLPCIACHLCERMHGVSSGQALVEGVTIVMLVSILRSGVPAIIVLNGMMHSLCIDHQRMYQEAANLNEKWEPKT